MGASREMGQWAVPVGSLITGLLRVAVAVTSREVEAVLGTLGSSKGSACAFLRRWCSVAGDSTLATTGMTGKTLGVWSQDQGDGMCPLLESNRVVAACICPSNP